MTGRLPLSSRLLQSPRVGFAMTTVALVALSSGTTGILVSHGASQLQPVVPHVVPSRAPSPHATPVLVERAPGSLLPHSITGVRQPARPAAAPARVVDVAPTTPIVVPVPVVEPPVVTPPVPGPPVLGPPVVDPGVVEPPVVAGPILEPNTKPNTNPGRRAHKPHPEDNGKHLGQLKH